MLEEVELISDLAPSARNLEGFLFPDTYRWTRHTTARDLILQMVERFRQVAAAHIQPGMDSSGLTLQQVVILASLIETETGMESERALVSSVFHNRLRRGIPLQCDPTVIYAAKLNGRFRGRIYQSDLDFSSPYNTYTIAGLPPGPIAKSGAEIAPGRDPSGSNRLSLLRQRQPGGTCLFTDFVAASTCRGGLQAGPSQAAAARPDPAHRILNAAIRSPRVAVNQGRTRSPAPDPGPTANGRAGAAGFGASLASGLCPCLGGVLLFLGTFGLAAGCPSPGSSIGNSSFRADRATGLRGGGDLSRQRPEGIAQGRIILLRWSRWDSGCGWVHTIPTWERPASPISSNTWLSAPASRPARNRPPLDLPSCRRPAAGLHLSGPDRLLCFGGEKQSGRPAQTGGPAPAA